jgi:hypothetical protein
MHIPDELMLKAVTQMPSYIIATMPGKQSLPWKLVRAVTIEKLTVRGQIPMVTVNPLAMKF